MPGLIYERALVLGVEAENQNVKCFRIACLAVSVSDATQVLQYLLNRF